VASRKFRIDLFDLVLSIARVVDIMSPNIANHHMKVAYLAYRITEEIGVPEHETYDLAMAGALHDIGAFSLKERLDLLEFEDAMPGEHSMAGYLLLKTFPPFAAISEIIKYHHMSWAEAEKATKTDHHVPMGCHIIHLADRVAVMINPNENVLRQVPHFRKTISNANQGIFSPEIVDAMLRLINRDYIWLDMASDSLESILRKMVIVRITDLDIRALLVFSE